jgi:hypothetical protein
MKRQGIIKIMTAELIYFKKWDSKLTTHEIRKTMIQITN